MKCHPQKYIDLNDQNDYTRYYYLDSLNVLIESVSHTWFQKGMSVMTYWLENCLIDKELNSSICFSIKFCSIGIRIHTPKEKETDLQHIDRNRLVIKCSIVPIVSSIKICSQARCHPHTEREKNRPPHIDRNRLNDLITKQFHLFLDLILFTGGWTHTLKEK